MARREALQEAPGRASGTRVPSTGRASGRTSGTVRFLELPEALPCGPSFLKLPPLEAGWELSGVGSPPRRLRKLR